MQRRGSSGQPVKGQSAIRPKARKSRIASASADHSPEQFEQLKRERDEALERETATSDILRIISNSPTDLQSALGAIAESAARLLEVAGAEISRVEGDGLRLMAKHGPLPQRPVGSIRPINRGWVMGRPSLIGLLSKFLICRRLRANFRKERPLPGSMGIEPRLPLLCYGKELQSEQS
jgi:hypothetical protein